MKLVFLSVVAIVLSACLVPFDFLYYDGDLDVSYQEILRYDDLVFVPTAMGLGVTTREYYSVESSPSPAAVNSGSWVVYGADQGLMNVTINDIIVYGGLVFVATAGGLYYNSVDHLRMGYSGALRPLDQLNGGYGWLPVSMGAGSPYAISEVTIANDGTIVAHTTNGLFSNKLSLVTGGGGTLLQRGRSPFLYPVWNPWTGTTSPSIPSGPAPLTSTSSPRSHRVRKVVHNDLTFSIAHGGGLLVASKTFFAFEGAKIYRVQDGLGSNVIHSIHVYGGVIYLATSRGLSVNLIRAILEEDGSLREPGSLGPDGWRTYTVEDGLPSNLIYSVVVRGQYLYVKTAAGKVVNLVKNIFNPDGWGLREPGFFFDEGFRAHYS